ncbi:hypothetical protein HDU98_003718 [Podochytrium sp. JEL0797]|nr:hypothetical protein HDU98_003718 [Podochytrium sp. JEL0797]
MRKPSEVAPPPPNPLLLTDGCPPPHLSLIGIFTWTDPLNTARRALLHDLYRRRNRLITDPRRRIDIRFIFGIPTTPHGISILDQEQRAFPEDVIVTQRPEGRDEGKILDFFRIARDMNYVPHPTVPGGWCQRYSYIGKGDDDAVFELQALSAALSEIVDEAGVDSESVPNYVGFALPNVYIPEERVRRLIMHGMLYFVNPAFVEWAAFSDLPRAHLIGIEDHRTGVWMELSPFSVEDRVNWRKDYFETHMDRWHPDGETLVVHPCKSIGMLRKCIHALDR